MSSVLNLKPKNVTTVIFKPPVYKENEIPLSELKDIKNYKPCGVETKDDRKIVIFYQDHSLIVQDMSNLTILTSDANLSLKGAIDSIEAKHGLKNVYLFESSEELRRWSK